MKPGILLVNPPIYDFAAYDFWFKPYGLLSIAGKLRSRADFAFFDYLDRFSESSISQHKLQPDRWGRGRFYSEKAAKPQCLKMIPRIYQRFGLPRSIFRQYLSQQKPFDFAMLQTTMTYWYPGLIEVIEDIRSFHPGAKIILGGNYVTVCSSHAEILGADLLVKGTNLEPLWQYLGLDADMNEPALWEAYHKPKVGAIKLSDGCPFKCTYCSVPLVYGQFKPRPLERALAEFELMQRLGVENVAFYDDALLYQSQDILVPFLDKLIQSNSQINLHSPNALNARFVNEEIVQLMVRAGFKTFYLGFESASRQWQQQTGSKVFSQELADAVEKLLAAGAERENITAYQILGHPLMDIQQLEDSMRFVHSLGIRGMLADFSPIPGTPDGEYCRRWVDLDEPLLHNKTAFPIIMLGFEESNRIKNLQRQLNRTL